MGSYAGRIAPPGMPNMTSTPSDSSDRTSDWAPVTDSATTVLTAGAAESRCPAAAEPRAAGGGGGRAAAGAGGGDGVAPDGGRGVACSDGVFVMTVTFGSVVPLGSAQVNV